MAAEWFYTEQGQQRGPVTFELLQQLASAGQLRPTDMVWKNGMPQWLPASSQAGLFGGGAAARPAAAPRDSTAEPRARDDKADFDRPKPKGGMSAGLKIALFGGGAAVLLGCLCCGVVGIIIFANLPPGNERSWSLKSNEHKDWKIKFNKGDKVDIWVTSKHDSDVDLFVFTDKTKMDNFLKSQGLDNTQYLRGDDNPDNNPKVSFTAPETQDYIVMVWNRAIVPPSSPRNRSNSGKLTFSAVAGSTPTTPTPKGP
jgi:hypothetical protein